MSLFTCLSYLCVSVHLCVSHLSLLPVCLSPVSLTCLSLTCLSLLCVQEVAPGLEPAPQNKLEDAKRQTDGVIKIMGENINSLIKREGNLEHLEEVFEGLEKEVAYRIFCS